MNYTDDRSSAVAEMAEYLDNYRFGLKMIEINRYEKEYFMGRDNRDVGGGAIGEDDEAYIKAKMFEIKRFVTSLPPDDRKLFLYYHYIRCETVERCAELLKISRRSAYRLKRRTLEYAAIKYRSFSKKEYDL
jgi:hypothetical protein